MCTVTFKGKGELLTDVCTDYVFVDEHNRHKRLKGMMLPEKLYDMMADSYFLQ